MIAQAEALLRTEGISKQYGSMQALHPLEFEMRRGEVRALVGENGAGKSTLIKVITGTVRPSSGRMWMNQVLVEFGSLVLTCAIGAGNGVLITRGRIPPFIATLCMAVAARGVALAVTAEEAVRIDRATKGFTWFGRGHLGPIPVPVAVFALAFAVSWVILMHTSFGRRVYAVGDNPEAARAMGSNEGSVLIPVYAISGALAGMAGVILASRLGLGPPVAGTGWELDAIAAVVVGGTLLTGGSGGVGSTVIGVLLLGLLFNVFNLEGTISSWWQWVLRGLFLLAVAVLQRVGASRDTELQR